MSDVTALARAMATLQRRRGHLADRLPTLPESSPVRGYDATEIEALDVALSAILSAYTAKAMGIDVVELVQELASGCKPGAAKERALRFVTLAQG